MVSISENNVIKIINTDTYINIATLNGVYTDDNTKIYISPENKKIIFIYGGGDCRTFIFNNWDTNTYDEIDNGEYGGFNCISEDGTIIANYYYNHNYVTIWDIDTHSELNRLELNINKVEVLCFQPTTEIVMW